MSKLNDKSKDHTWQWSPKHTRLRYQLLLSAIVVFYVGSYNVTEFTVPLLFAKLHEDSGPSKSLLLVSTMCFYIFTLISLCIRSKNEQKQIGDYQDRLISSMSKVRSVVQSLNKQSITYIQNFANDYPDEHALDHAIQQIDSSLRRFPTSFKIQSHRPFDWEKVQNIPNDALTKDIKILSDKIDKHYERIHTLITARKLNSEEEFGKYTDLQQKAISEINTVFVDGEARIKKILAKERRDRRSFFWEREVLGLWFPIIVSVLIALAGLGRYFLNCKDLF